MNRVERTDVVIQILDTVVQTSTFVAGKNEWYLQCYRCKDNYMQEHFSTYWTCADCRGEYEEVPQEAEEAK